jgi:hypothetical protein
MVLSARRDRASGVLPNVREPPVRSVGKSTIGPASTQHVIMFTLKI